MWLLCIIYIYICTPCIYLYIYICIFLSIYLSIDRSIHPSIHLSIPYCDPHIVLTMCICLQKMQMKHFPEWIQLQHFVSEGRSLIEAQAHPHLAPKTISAWNWSNNHFVKQMFCSPKKVRSMHKPQQPSYLHPRHPGTSNSKRQKQKIVWQKLKMRQCAKYHQTDNNFARFASLNSQMPLGMRKTKRHIYQRSTNMVCNASILDYISKTCCVIWRTGTIICQSGKAEST